jgi:hypothetical protein
MLTCGAWNGKAAPDPREAGHRPEPRAGCPSFLTGDQYSLIQSRLINRLPIPRSASSRCWRYVLRRTCARLCHLASGELDQIQFLLGHVSIQTTERYLACKQRLSRAVNDKLGIEPGSGFQSLRFPAMGRPGSARHLATRIDLFLAERFGGAPVTVRDGDKSLKWIAYG